MACFHLLIGKSKNVLPSVYMSGIKSEGDSYSKSLQSQVLLLFFAPICTMVNTCQAGSDFAAGNPMITSAVKIV